MFEALSPCVFSPGLGVVDLEVHGERESRKPGVAIRRRLKRASQDWMVFRATAAAHLISRFFPLAVHGKCIYTALNPVFAGR